MEKWLIPGLGQKMHKISLENLMVPESKELPPKGCGVRGGCQKNTKANLKVP